MKKIFQIILILAIMMIGVVSPTGFAQGSPVQGEPDPSEPLDLPIKVFLPVIIGGSSTYLVSGQVLGPEAEPLAGAVVSDGSGRTAITDQGGFYQIALPAGTNALAPSKEGYLFTPSMVDINVTSNLVDMDFNAVDVCIQGVQNGDFEANAWWLDPGSTPAAAYTTEKYHSPLRSVRTGITSLMANTYGYSSIRTPLISVPTSATSVTLRMWLYPKSSELVTTTLAPEPNVGEFGDTTNAYDAQYVLILDDAGNLLETLLWMRSNVSMWTYYEFNLSKWSGHDIKLQIGSYNDGTDGITSLYIDDVSLEMCGCILPPPPPPEICSNLFFNSGFEFNANWGIPITTYPAGYSYDYAYAGLRSMRTGIPLPTGVNVYSYSDAWQTVTIPASATSATLRMKILPRSQEISALASEMDSEGVEAEMPPPGTKWGDATLAYDTMYILVLNPYTEQIIETLWSRTNLTSTEWKSREFDLLKYRGQSIRIQFGTFNDGLGGKSALYVDEAYFDMCTGDEPPEPEPICSERISNKSFETNLAWYIPVTAFSAGYSTYRAHTGLRSMRTGIVYSYHNRFSYSDFGQVVSIPAGSSSAVLSMWLYNSTSELYTAALPEQPAPDQIGEVELAGDVQYLLVLDYWGNWIDTLIWQKTNDGYWKYKSFDLKKYAGSTIRLQWGTYNDGWGGITSMYVDDVSLVACP